MATQVRPACFKDAEELLANHGWPNSEVFRVESVGDSGEEATVILFVHRRKPRIGYLELKDGKEELDVKHGWNV